MEWLEDKDFCIAKVNTKTEAVEQITRENPEALAWVDFPRVGRVLQTGLPHHLSTIPVNIADFEEASVLGGDTAEYQEGIKTKKPLRRAAFVYFSAFVEGALLRKNSQKRQISFTLCSLSISHLNSKSRFEVTLWVGRSQAAKWQSAGHGSPGTL